MFIDAWSGPAQAAGQVGVAFRTEMDPEIDDEVCQVRTSQCRWRAAAESHSEPLSTPTCDENILHAAQAPAGPVSRALPRSAATAFELSAEVRRRLPTHVTVRLQRQSAQCLRGGRWMQVLPPAGATAQPPPPVRRLPWGLGRLVGAGQYQSWAYTLTSTSLQARAETVQQTD